MIGERYELLEVIGHGGMGTVHRGRDVKTDTFVAIKELKPEIVQLDPSIVERFEREGEALRRLDHPNIVKMLGTVAENNTHYLIMEYVSGGTLGDLMCDPLSIEKILDLALDIADALTRAHRLKILHRDIKPANVLLAEDGTPRLTDFGVARMEDRTRVTEAGVIVGTYSYLSPEAINGEELDERTDIWAFGVMLYEMLTGKRPFEDDSVGAIINAILNQPVPDILEHRADIPPVLGNLVSRMLEKDRTQRINSARIVGAELEAIIRGVEPSEIDSDIRQKAVDGGRFDTPTPRIPQNTTLRHHGLVSVGTDPESGEEVYVIRKKSARVLDFATFGFLLLLIGIIAAIVLMRGHGRQNETAPSVEPVAAGETMVLVAGFEAVGTAERDVARFIYDNLEINLEPLPFSQIRIRVYPEIFHTDDEAEAAAEATGAAVVIWGNYDDESIIANVQVGVTDDFNYIEMPIDILRRTANVRIRLTNERTQSLASEVLGVIGVLYGADGNAYDFMRTIAILDTLDVESGEIISSGVSGYVHDYYQLYLQDTEAALVAMQDAISLDASNPLLYILLSVSQTRLGDNENAARSAGTAQRLGPSNWSIPYVMLATSMMNPNDALGYMSQSLELRPDDWYIMSTRASIYYLRGDYDLAQADLDAAIGMNPTANMPYVYSALIAMREARVRDTQALINTIVEEYPDPTIMNRVVSATFGDQPGFYTTVIEAFGYLIIGQFDIALRVIEDSESLPEQVPDLYFLQGMAQCELEQYDESVASFSRSVELDGSFGLAWLMLASASQRAGDIDAANQILDQLSTAATSMENLPPEGTQYLDFIRDGSIGCDTLFR